MPYATVSLGCLGRMFALASSELESLQSVHQSLIACLCCGRPKASAPTAGDRSFVIVDGGESGLVHYAVSLELPSYLAFVPSVLPAESVRPTAETEWMSMLGLCDEIEDEPAPAPIPVSVPPVPLQQDAKIPSDQKRPVERILVGGVEQAAKVGKRERDDKQKDTRGDGLKSGRDAVEGRKEKKDKAGAEAGKGAAPLSGALPPGPGGKSSKPAVSQVAQPRKDEKGDKATLASTAPAGAAVPKPRPKPVQAAPVTAASKLGAYLQQQLGGMPQQQQHAQQQSGKRKR